MAHLTVRSWHQMASSAITMPAFVSVRALDGEDGGSCHDMKTYELRF